jgi:hypothetical protein
MNFRMQQMSGRFCLAVRGVFSPITRASIATLVFFAVCSIATSVYGQPSGGWRPVPTPQVNGIKVQLPFNLSVSPLSRLSLTVDTRWSNSYGYRPIEVSVASPRASSTDRFITVRLHGSGSGSIRVTQVIKLPARRPSVTATIALPQYKSSGQFVWWEVWVDGVKDDELSLIVKSAIAAGINSNYGAASGLSILTVGANTRALVAPTTYEFETLLLPIDSFPKRWIEYTCFDVVLMSATDLETLEKSNPVAMGAMQQWLRAGGQLWVTEVGKQLEQLEELSQQFQLADTIDPGMREGSDTSEVAIEEDTQEFAWMPVRFRDGIREGQIITFLEITSGESRVERDPEAIQRLQRDPNYVATDSRFEAIGEGPERRWPANSGAWFVEQSIGLGVVRAFRGKSEATEVSAPSGPVDPNAVDSESAMRLPRPLELALRSSERWQGRHGMAPDDANRDFANLLVPGVGLAPVTAFRVLITLFVLLIGPVNYWLLKRYRRLHLMVLTVPLAAALMTATLFAYATFSDGFGTSVRIHSFTALDQRSGEAACWSRISYYSGIAPANGLTMPDDVAIYPINPAWNVGAVDANMAGARELIWGNDEARLTRGWLRSRTPTQYLTVRSRRSPNQLELAATDEKLRVTNKLSTEVKFLLVLDGAEKFWTCENLKDDAREFLKPIEFTEAVRSFRQIVVDNEPQTPTALSAGDSHYSVLQRRQARRMFGRRFGMRAGEARLTTNLVNQALTELAGLSGTSALALPPRSYLAVTATGPEVVVGIGRAQEEASFHVVVGKW